MLKGANIVVLVTIDKHIKIYFHKNLGNFI